MSELAKWDSFYVIVGSAAGALIGLQFVVLTLIAERPPAGAAEAGAAFGSPTITSMSPLHYQKVLRLQEARRLMLSTMMDAGTASQRVGYLSASQFSREYSRFFGCAPTRDIARLRQETQLRA